MHAPEYRTIRFKLNIYTQYFNLFLFAWFLFTYSERGIFTSSSSVGGGMIRVQCYCDTAAGTYLHFKGTVIDWVIWNSNL